MDVLLLAPCLLIGAGVVFLILPRFALHMTRHRFRRDYDPTPTDLLFARLTGATALFLGVVGLVRILF